MKVGGITTWKELTIGVQQLVRLMFINNFINPGPGLQLKFVATWKSLILSFVNQQLAISEYFIKLNACL